MVIAAITIRIIIGPLLPLITETKAIAKLMEAIRGAASMGRRPCSYTPRGTRRAARGTTEVGGQKTLPAAGAKLVPLEALFGPGALDPNLGHSH